MTQEPEPRTPPALLAGALLGLGLFARGAPSQAKVPDPLREQILCAPRMLERRPGLRPSPELLEAAREALRKGGGLEAAMVLGLGGSRADRDRLISLSREGKGELRDRATLALGYCPDPVAVLHLSRMLERRKASSRSRAMAALALGIDHPDKRETGDTASLTAHVQRILDLNVSQFAGELSACFFGMPEDGGGAVFRNFLEKGSISIESGSRKTPSGRAYPVVMGVDSNLKGLAYAGLASRLATIEEWSLVRTGLNAPKRHRIHRYLSAWGFFKGRGQGLTDRLRDKVRKILVKRIGSEQDPRVAAMHMLALGRVDRKEALKLARSLVKRRRTPPHLRGAAFLVIGEQGEGKDLASLTGMGKKAFGNEEQAGWALGLALLASRIRPSDHPEEPAEGSTLPEPVVILRSKIAVPGTTDPRLAETAACLGLALLKDRFSAPRIHRFYLAASDGDIARALSLAWLSLGPQDLDTTEDHRGPDWPMLTALAESSHPRFLEEAEALLGSASLTPEARSRLFHLASRALAGPGLRLDEQIEARLGPTALPAPLPEVLGWQKVDARAKMGAGAGR